MRIRYIALGICICAFSSNAAILTVTTTDDHGPGSLRDAIATASSGDTIQFAAGLSGQTIVLTSTYLDIAKDLTIDGPGAHQLTVTQHATPSNHVLYVSANHSVTIKGLTISGGSLPYSGGGIFKEGEGNLTIVNSIISDNQAGVFGFGGGIYNYGGVVTISNSTLSGNFAGQRGGAIYNAVGTVILDRSTIKGNSAYMGGGIYNHSSLSLSNSTLSGNSAFNANSSFEGGSGIYNDGQSASLNNCTVTGNTVDHGGAIVNDGSNQGDATLTISHCTLSGNSPLGISNMFGTVSIGDTILSAGSGANIYNVSGSVTSSGYNLSSDDGSGFLKGPGDQINTNPMLGPPLNNGGPTFTHKLLSGSPAINAADPSFTPPPEYDQRGPGFVRVFDGRLDIGSFEAQPTPTPTKLLNISTRLRVLTDDNVGIGGFIVSGNEPKRVLLRAIGPSLTSFGVPGALPDPALELHGPGTFGTITNDNWRDTQEAEIEATGLAPTNDLESAIVAVLSPGAYTAIVRGNDGGTGVALVEAYDLNSAADAQLANISTRGFVDTGDNVMIGGLILGNGSMDARVLIRAIGPSLTAFGVPNALTDPTLELHNNNGAIIAANDDWRDTQQAEIADTGIPPSDDRESAIVQPLAPGAYTAIVRGKNDSLGVALVEAYQLAPAPTPAATPSPYPTATPSPSPTPSPTPSPSPTPVTDPARIRDLLLSFG